MRPLVPRWHVERQTFLDVTMEHPEQYLSTRRSKKLSKGAEAYIKWVEKNFDIDPDTKHSKPANTQHVSARPRRGDGAGLPSLEMCPYKEVHHKGSSARYLRTTCYDCLEMWQVERNPVTQTAEECLHRRTDHRGSNKQVRTTYCPDCGSYIDSVAQEVARSLKAEAGAGQEVLQVPQPRLVQ